MILIRVLILVNGTDSNMLAGNSSDDAAPRGCGASS